MWERTVKARMMLAFSGRKYKTFTLTILVRLLNWKQEQKKSKSCFPTGMIKDGLFCAKGQEWFSVDMGLQFLQSFRNLLNGSRKFSKGVFLKNVSLNGTMRANLLAVSFKSRRVMDISHILKNVLTVPKSWRCISGSDAATNTILLRQHIRRKYLLHHSYTKLCRSQHVGLIAEYMPIYKIIIAALFLYLQYYFYSIIVCVSKFVTSVKV